MVTHMQLCPWAFLLRLCGHRMLRSPHSDLQPSSVSLEPFTEPYHHCQPGPTLVQGSAVAKVMILVRAVQSVDALGLG